MPQTTGCALTHRLPSNTTTAARPPADLPPLPVEEGRGGVRLHTASEETTADLLAPARGRFGVVAALKRTASEPHQTSSFTYTPSAQAYVKKTIGCALGRVCNSNFPPLRCGGGAGRGCENRVATAFKTKCKQPIAHRLPSNTTTAARPPLIYPLPLWGRVRVGFAYIPPMQNHPPFCTLPRGRGLGWGQQKNMQRPNPIEHPHLHTPRALKRM